MAQQTAVEFIFKKINVLDNDSAIPISVTATKEIWNDIFEEAKAMEKEQIKEAFKDGVHEGVLTDINYLKCDKDAEYYYNQTYNK